MTNYNNNNAKEFSYKKSDGSVVRVWSDGDEWFISVKDVRGNVFARRLERSELSTHWKRSRRA